MNCRSLAASFVVLEVVLAFLPIHYASAEDFEVKVATSRSLEFAPSGAIQEAFGQRIVWTPALLSILNRAPDKLMDLNQESRTEIEGLRKELNASLGFVLNDSKQLDSFKQKLQQLEKHFPNEFRARVDKLAHRRELYFRGIKDVLLSLGASEKTLTAVNGNINDYAAEFDREIEVSEKLVFNKTMEAAGIRLGRNVAENLDTLFGDAARHSTLSIQYLFLNETETAYGRNSSGSALPHFVFDVDADGSLLISQSQRRKYFNEALYLLKVTGVLGLPEVYDVAQDYSDEQLRLEEQLRKRILALRKNAPTNIEQRKLFEKEKIEPVLVEHAKALEKLSDEILDIVPASSREKLDCARFLMIYSLNGPIEAFSSKEAKKLGLLEIEASIKRLGDKRGALKSLVTSECLRIENLFIKRMLKDISEKKVLTFFDFVNVEPLVGPPAVELLRVYSDELSSR